MSPASCRRRGRRRCVDPLERMRVAHVPARGRIAQWLIAASCSDDAACVRPHRRRHRLGSADAEEASRDSLLANVRLNDMPRRISRDS